MASYEDLIDLLSAVHIYERKKHRATVVAGHLIVYILKEKCDKLPQPEIQELLKASTDRLWENYKQKRTQEKLPSRSAALRAINDEIEFLKTNFNLKD